MEIMFKKNEKKAHTKYEHGSRVVMIWETCSHWIDYVLLSTIALAYSSISTTQGLKN